MMKKLRKLADQIVEFHKEIYQELSSIEEETKTVVLREQLADTAYFMREINSHLDDVGKHVRRIQGLAEKLACYVTTQMPNLEEATIRTDYVTATPKLKMAITLPHHRKQPEEFAALMEWLKVPREHWDCEEPSINLRWNGVIEAITKAGEEGRPLPKGVDVNKQHPQYSLRMLKKLAITENPPTENDDGVF